MKVAATKLQKGTTTKNYYFCAPHNKKKEAKKTVRFVTIVAVMTAFNILILVLVSSAATGCWGLMPTQT